MELFKDLFVNRRGYAFILPIVVVGLQRAGIIVTEEAVGTLLDQTVALIAGVLAFWSLARPKS